MPRTKSPSRRTTALLVAAIVALGSGWTFREFALAREQNPALTSRTITLDQLKMAVYTDQGNAVGHIGLYLQGESPGCSSLVTGRFIVDPGKSPHPPHVHDDEEVLIVQSGQGEIVCEGKTTKVGEGSVMYSTPGVPHGLNNTGQEPLVFYFIKWTPRGSNASAGPGR